MGIFDFLDSAVSGTPAEYEQQSLLTPGQKRIEKGRQRAAKGSFKQAGNYWRDILDNNPEAFAAFEAPAQRQFNEQIIPDLAEQFAGMGFGGAGLNSSGFQTALGSAGVDLSERLASMRAGLRENAASNLFNLGQSALNPTSQWVQTNPGSQGGGNAFMQGLGGAIPGAVSGFLAGGPAGAGVGAVGGFTQGFGKSSPYGNQQSSSGYNGSFGQLPQFGQR